MQSVEQRHGVKEDQEALSELLPHVKEMYL